MQSQIFLTLICAANVSLFAAGAPTGSTSEPGEFSSSASVASQLSKADFDLLNKAQVENEKLFESLQSFVCDETIVRSHASLDLSSVRRIDTLTAKVSFENGTERYTDVRSNNRARASISHLNGAWSEGEFGTLLRQTRELLNSQQVTVLDSVMISGAPTLRFQFDVSESETPWTLIVEGHSYRIPFRTVVSIDKASGQILEVHRRSMSIPAETRISELQWSVRLDGVAVRGARWLLPVSGEYSVLYADENRREWNRLEFSNYRRYGSEVALRY